MSFAYILIFIKIDNFMLKSLCLKKSLGQFTVFKITIVHIHEDLEMGGGGGGEGGGLIFTKSFKFSPLFITLKFWVIH